MFVVLSLSRYPAPFTYHTNCSGAESIQAVYLTLSSGTCVRNLQLQLLKLLHSQFHYIPVVFLLYLPPCTQIGVYS